jgi:hypothetical protein
VLLIFLVFSAVFSVLFFLVLCPVYPMLPVSLDCPFLITPSVFSNVYLYKSIAFLIFLLLFIGFMSVISSICGRF